VFSSDFRRSQKRFFQFIFLTSLGSWQETFMYEKKKNSGSKVNTGTTGAAKHLKLPQVHTYVTFKDTIIFKCYGIELS
jgi:hypothetical protein